MNTITQNVIRLEQHCLQLSYQSLRLQRTHELNKVLLSMESQGQLMPVVVVPKVNNQWILIDGYLRVNALRRLGKDFVDAQVWDCDVAQALLRLLMERQSHRYELIEEALLLQELHIQHGISQSDLAKKMGCDKSWVSRRLVLLSYVSEPTLQSILQGKLSLWAATRIMAPLARANMTHSERLLDYLLSHHHSTRELQQFYDHYQKSPHSQRARMINHPDLFFKTQRLLTLEKQSNKLQAGPEGEWNQQLQSVGQRVTSLIPIASQIFTPHQDGSEKTALMIVFNNTKAQFDLLTHTVRNLTDANERHTADDCQPEKQGPQSPCNQSTTKDITHDGTNGDSRRYQRTHTTKNESLARDNSDIA